MDKYHDKIMSVLTEKGELGVNDIAKLIEIHPSTLQKYLDRQTYFKKTERRKWDLPQNVNTDIKSHTMTLMADSVENALLLLRAQLTELQDSVDNSLIPIKTLKRGISSLTAPVADKVADIDERFLDLDKKAKETMSVFKQYASKIPEEYRNELLNFDYVWLVLDKGMEYASTVFATEISSLLLGQTDTLSAETEETITKYQKVG